MIASSEPAANPPRLPRGALRAAIDNSRYPLGIGGGRIGRWRRIGPIRLVLLLGKQGRHTASLVVGEVARQEPLKVFDVLIVNEPVHVEWPYVDIPPLAADCTHHERNCEASRIGRFAQRLRRA